MNHCRSIMERPYPDVRNCHQSKCLAIDLSGLSCVAALAGSP
jgi:hypothetical protein